MNRVYNFSPGPAMLPDEVLRRAQAEMLDWHNLGMSIMELGHRGEEFQALAKKIEGDFRELMVIPANYQVLFLAGGASTQFAMVPLNLLGKSMKADYLDTGVWSKKAIEEAKHYGEINIAARKAYHGELAYIPSQEEWSLSNDAAYVHYTPNETIDGVQFGFVPQTGEIPLVADMTSMILSAPINVSDYGIIYAGAQKNMGQAGLNVVIIRNDLIKDPLPFTPTLYRYKVQAENHSFYNTPPTYSWYLAGLVFEWMKEKGGVPAFYEMNKRKAKTLYDFIDQYPNFYVNKVEKHCRSLMNVMFYLRHDELTQQFLAEANQIGLTNLRGHRVSGGVRASIYNAMPQAGVDKLVTFMFDFAKRNS